MFIGEIVGKTVSTIKDARLQGLSLVMVRRVNSDNKAGEVFVAADTIGCGDGDLVILAGGSAARMAVGLGNIPVDLAVVGIVDPSQKKRREKAE